MQPQRNSEVFDVVVIGAGQAGLSVGYHLARQGRSFVILERNSRIGDSWRHRWDSLRLFTPAQYDGIVGMPFPAAAHTFPTKDEMADYLESYAAHFNLPVRTGISVDRLWRDGDRYVMTANGQRFESRHVVVAMASYQQPRVPAFSRELAASIVQLHSRDYRNPGQLQEGPVLIVGAGNSGAEIARELASRHRVYVAGRDVGQVPFRMGSLVSRVLLPIVFRVVFHRILTVRTPMGRKLRPRVLTQGGPLIRVKWADLAAAGATRVPRVAGTSEGRPLLDDGRVLDVANVIWCTGFTPGFSWIDIPITDASGEPQHEAGVVPGEPGLYFVGLHFLYAFSSTMIHGIARDAERIASTIGRRFAMTRSTSARPSAYATTAAPAEANRGRRLEIKDAT